jgi:hypothetical protein
MIGVNFGKLRALSKVMQSEALHVEAVLAW